MTKLSVMSIVMLGAALALGACTPATQPEPTADPAASGDEPMPIEPEVLPLVTQMAPQAEFEEALLTGILEYDENGCWRVSSEGTSFLIVWPAGFTATAMIGAPQVLDADGNAVGTAGMEISLGGGAREGDAAAAYEEEHPDLPSEQCPGPYWIVGVVAPAS